MVRRIAIVLVLDVFLTGLAAAATGVWSSAGPDGGTVTAMAFHPGDSRIVFVAADLAGVFRSDDGGESWRRLGLADTRVASLAVAASTPPTVYAGLAGGGVYRSADGGASWVPAAAGLGPGPILSLAVDPRNPAHLLAGGDGSSPLYASDDGGDSWQAVAPAGRVAAIVFHPADPATVLASSSLGVLRSGDGGATWQASTAGLTRQSPNGQAYVLAPASLAVSPVDRDLVFGAGGREVVRSRDGGITWTTVLAPAGEPGLVAVAVHPTDPSVIWAVAREAGGFISTDGGERWTAMSSLQCGEDQLGPLVFQARRLLADPDAPGSLLLGTELRGVLRSDDGGASWRDANRGLAATRVLAVAADPGRPGRLLAGTDNGVFASADGGATWAGSNGGLGDPCGLQLRGIIEIAPVPYCMEVTSLLGNPDGHWLAATACALHWGGDGGWAWSELPNQPGTGRFARSANDPDLVFLAGAAVWRSDTGGAQWRACGALPAFDDGTGEVGAVLVDPDDDRRVLAGVGQHVVESNDGCRSWHELGTTRSPLCWSSSATPVQALAKARGSTRILAGTACGLFTGGPEGWVLTALAGTSVNAVVFDTRHNGAVYAATSSLGVQRSSDGGITWLPFGDGLPTLEVVTLAYDEGGSRLWVGTAHNGAWQRDIPRSLRLRLPRRGAAAAAPAIQLR